MLRAFLFAVLATALFVKPAAAQQSCPLQAFQQSWSDQLQFETRTIDGQVALIASGVIGPNDYQRLRAQSDQTPYRDLLINSPGGDLEAAVRIAHSAWASGKRVRVPRGWVCGDACMLIVHSAQVARAEPGSLLFWSPVRRVLNEEVLTPAITVDAQGGLIFKKSWGQEVWSAYNLHNQLLRNAGRRIPVYKFFDDSPHMAHPIATPATAWRDLANIPGFVCTTSGDESLRLGRTERTPLAPFTLALSPPRPVMPARPAAAFAVSAPTSDWPDVARSWPSSLAQLSASSRNARATVRSTQTEGAALDLMREAVAHAHVAKPPTDVASFTQHASLVATLSSMNETLVSQQFRGTLAGGRLEGDADLFGLKQTIAAQIVRLSAQRNDAYPSLASAISAEFSGATTRALYDETVKRVYGMPATTLCPTWSPYMDGNPPPRSPPAVPGGRDSAVYGAATEACERGRMGELYSSRELDLMAGSRTLRVPASYSAPSATEIMRVIFRESAATSAARRVDFNVEHSSGMNEYMRDVNTSLAIVGRGGMGDSGTHSAGILTTIKAIQIRSCARSPQGGYTCSFLADMNLRRNQLFVQLDRMGIFETFVQAINARMPSQLRYRFVLTPDGWRSPDMRAAMAERREKNANAFYEGMGRSAASTIRAHCAMREAANDIWVQGDPNCRR